MTSPPAEPTLADVRTQYPHWACARGISGHVHQYRLLRLDGADHLWAPTTWAVLPDEAQPVFGVKRCGIVSLDLAAGPPPQPEFVAPDGLAQLTMTRDLPDPYHQ